LTHHTSHRSHEEYEWDRLKCGLSKGQRNMLRTKGCTLEPVSWPGDSTQSVS
jgi:hypothetical protein